MKEGWAESRLGDVLVALRNGVNCKQDKSGEGEKVSRIESISDATFNPERVGYAKLTEGEMERYRLLPGDILFSHINSPIHVGKTAIFDSSERVYHGVNLLLMRAKPEVAPAYLNYALKLLFQAGYWKRACKQSVNQASVNQQDISKVKIFYPCSLAEQQRIVAILDAAFADIAAAKANAEKNLQNARALFDSYLKSIFMEQGDEWQPKQLGQVAEVQSGGTPTVSIKEFWNGDIPWYSSGELNKTLTTNPERHITSDGLNSSNAKLFPKGSLLVGMYDTAALKMSILDRDGAFNQAIAGVKPNENIDVEFILHAINSEKTRLLLERRGVRQKNLSLGKIKEIDIPLPALEKQREVVAQLCLFRSEAQRLESNYQQKLTALDELKKSLLHQAFSGLL